MPNWLTKATGGSTPQASDVPQTFHLTCDCAEQHTGQRKVRPQRIVCQTCGTALFVLPKNVYPILRERPTRKKQSRKAGGTAVPRGRRLPSANKLASSVRSGVTGAVSGVGRGVGSAATATSRRIKTSAVSVGQSVRASLTPFRVVVLGITMMLVATAVFAVRSHTLETARETFRAESAAGQEALTAEDLVEARGHFALAAAAADRLGSDDAPAREVRRWHQEAVALTNLAPESLFELLDEAEKYRSRPGGLSWADFFRSRYEEKWIVLHAPVRPGETGMIVDIPLFAGPRQTVATVQADIAHLDALPAVNGVTMAVIAAPLAGCEFDQEADAWIVTLDPQAGFLWSHAESLRSLGFFESEWIDEADVAALLDAQTQLTGGAP